MPDLPRPPGWTAALFAAVFYCLMMVSFAGGMKFARWAYDYRWDPSVFPAFVDHVPWIVLILAAGLLILATAFTQHSIPLAAMSGNPGIAWHPFRLSAMLRQRGMRWRWVGKWRPADYLLIPFLIVLMASWILPIASGWARAALMAFAYLLLYGFTAYGTWRFVKIRQFELMSREDDAVADAAGLRRGADG